MRKKEIKNIIVFLAITLLGCNGIDKTIEVEQMETNLPVVLKFSPKYKKIRLIYFPIKFKIHNVSLKKRFFSTIEYEYSNSFGRGVPLYIKNENKLIRMSKSKLKPISFFETKEYIIYTRHRIDSSMSIQRQFKPYIEKMQVSGQDTLIVKSLKEFKIKHSNFLFKLVDKDSILLNFMNKESEKGYWDFIKLPVKF